MSSKTKKLGALADIYQSKHLDGSISNIKLSRIKPSEIQPRQDRKNALNDLAESLKTDGLLSPIIVVKEKESYRIIAGERRFHAASSLGWESIECKIISRKDSELWRIAIIENLQRENLTPEEEASALSKLKDYDNLSDAQIAKMVGKSRNYISEILGIAQLPKEAIELCKSKGITQHNMLIQAVQAFRKGKLDEFATQFSQGNIDTVKKAKEFNKNKETTTLNQKIKTISDNIKISEEFDYKDFKIILDVNKISIESDDKSKIEKLLIKIKSLLNSPN